MLSKYYFSNIVAARFVNCEELCGSARVIDCGGNCVWDDCDVHDHDGDDAIYNYDDDDDDDAVSARYWSHW